MPTIKQELAVKKKIALTQKNGREPHTSEVMRAVGYSENTIKHPGSLTNSKGWKELLEQYLPDDLLLRKHEEALEATRWNDFTGEREEDHGIRLRATELGYKLKGKLTENNVLQQFNIGEMSLEFIDKDASSINKVATGSSEGQPQV